MKISDGFDARRLRPKSRRNWRSHLVLAFTALLTACGALMALAGTISLIGHPRALGELNASPVGAALILVLGLLVCWLSAWLWRRRRRHQIHQQSGLSIAPHLMKKRG